MLSPIVVKGCESRAIEWRVLPPIIAGCEEIWAIELRLLCPLGARGVAKDVAKHVAKEVAKGVSKGATSFLMGDGSKISFVSDISCFETTDLFLAA